MVQKVTGSSESLLYQGNQQGSFDVCCVFECVCVVVQGGQDVPVVLHPADLLLLTSLWSLSGLSLDSLSDSLSASLSASLCLVSLVSLCLSLSGLSLSVSLWSLSASLWSLWPLWSPSGLCSFLSLSGLSVSLSLISLFSHCSYLVSVWSLSV